ncbi:hypothetical protein NC652_036481 [Populus alba x Populus x berolinensis]|nr:hypothetical protein NC652_036481 [Populus alba x Populus x berolinensis]
MASNLINNNNTGSIEVVKKSSRQLIERYYSRMTLDFHTNKKALEEIQKGPVRGISLKLQAEEREGRMDFVPEVSAIKSDQIEVDKETMDMLASLGMSCFPGLVQVDPVTRYTVRVWKRWSWWQVGGAQAIKEASMTLPDGQI